MGHTEETKPITTRGTPNETGEISEGRLRGMWKLVRMGSTSAIRHATIRDLLRHIDAQAEKLRAWDIARAIIAPLDAQLAADPDDPIGMAEQFAARWTRQVAALAARDAQILRLSKDYEDMAACCDEPISRASRERDEDLAARVIALETGLTGHLQRATVPDEPAMGDGIDADEMYTEVLRLLVERIAARATVVAPQQIGVDFGVAHAAMRMGFRAKRANWPVGHCVEALPGRLRFSRGPGGGDDDPWTPLLSSVLAHDWEIIEGEKP